MLKFLHSAIIVIYLAMPIVAMCVAIFVRRRAQARRGRLLTTIAGAVVLGVAVSICSALAMDGSVSPGQVILCVYLTTSLLLILAALDRALINALEMMARRAVPADANTFRRRAVDVSTFTVRAAVLIAIAVPYLFAAAATYRPKVVAHADPTSELGMRYDTVRLQTADALSLAGWWIPANQMVNDSVEGVDQRGASNAVRLSRRQTSGRDTVIICHGMGSSKAGALHFARLLVPAGYNVLLFDFRAHGQSDGQLTSLGNLERQDVLAAVRWIGARHPDESKRILGLGISTGAAALIEAAVDPSPQGQAIDAVAVIEGFDSLRAVGQNIARRHFITPIGWLADHAGLALASAEVGADLLHFAPADDVKNLWPRPILFVQGGQDSLIPFESGERLYDAADEPKRRVWLAGSDYDQTMNSATTAREILEFFDEAQPVPAI